MSKFFQRLINKIFHKKYIIKLIFVLPLINSLLVALYIDVFVKHYTDKYIDITIDLVNPVVYVHELHYIFIVIAGVMLLNVVINFIAMMLYYCLEDKIHKIIHKRR